MLVQVSSTHVAPTHSCLLGSFQEAEFTFCCWDFFLFIECISDKFLMLEKIQHCKWEKLCCHTNAPHLLFLQVVMTLEGIPCLGDGGDKIEPLLRVGRR